MTVAHVLSRFGALTALIGCLLALQPTAAAANPAAAREVVLNLEREGLALASPGMPIAEKEQRFRHALRTYFDLPTIARFVLGRYWNTTSEPERQQFVSLFEDLTTRIWARRFSDYQGEGLDIRDIQPITDGFTVQTAVWRARGQPVPVAWRLAHTPSGLKVVDIIVEGVSMAITHRSEYASVLRSSGMSGLLTAMQNQLALPR